MAWLPVLCALAALRGVVVAGLVPPLNGPDEPAHWDYVQHVAETAQPPELRVYCSPLRSDETRALERAFQVDVAFHADRPAPPPAALAAPDPRDRRSRATTGCGPDAFYPPLYFATGAAAYRARYDAPVLERLFAARLASVAWGVTTVAFAYLGGAWWFGTAADAVLLALAFLLQPMLAFLGGVVTNDAALFACATGSLAAIAWASRRPDRVAPLALLASCTTAGALTKPTATLLAPAFAACTVLALGPRRLGAWVRTALALAPAAAAGYAWARFSQPAMDDMILHPARPFMPIGAYLAEWVFDWQRLFGTWVHEYWSVWGWADTPLRAPYYQAVVLAMALAAAGLALRWRLLAPRERVLVAAAAGCTAYALVALYAIDYRILSWQGIGFVQGRYVLPLFGLHAVVLVTGARALGRWADARIDGAWVLPATLAALNVAAVLRVLVRYYG